MLNRRWRTVSQNTSLYAFHLSNCSSYALCHQAIPKSAPPQKDLGLLKAKFSRQVRRNLFDAFIHPSETLVNLISTSAPSSAAFPRGEALRFIFSSQGQTLLALSSSRIFVIDLGSDTPKAKRELKTARRPITATISNDGSLLAVLSTKHQVNVYELTDSCVNHLRVISLDNPPRAITLSDEGTVLAAACEGGVEVFSLAAKTPATDRRAVRCEVVDFLTFSADGSSLLGSSSDISEPNTVVITAPYYTENDPNLTSRDFLSRMWTTQILFPQNSYACSHAVLLNSHNEGDSSWLLVYDRSLNTYRIVRADDTRTGSAYLLGPDSRRHGDTVASMLPSVTLNGELAAAAFAGAGLYVYGLPERIDLAPNPSHIFQRKDSLTNGGEFSLMGAKNCQEPLAAYAPPLQDTTFIEEDQLMGMVDRQNSLFIRPRRVSSLEDAVAATWVARPSKEASARRTNRLAMVAPGGVPTCDGMYGDYLPVDGGRILLLDFEYGHRGPRKRTITIEVGENVPETLPEQPGSLDVEVEVARRRTVWGLTDPERRWSLGRSATAIVSPSARMSTRLEEGGSRASISQPPSPTDRPRLHTTTLTRPDQSGSYRIRQQKSSPSAVATQRRNRARSPAYAPQEPAISSPTTPRRSGHRHAVVSMPPTPDSSEPPPPPPYRRKPASRRPPPQNSSRGRRSLPRLANPSEQQVQTPSGAGSPWTPTPASATSPNHTQSHSAAAAGRAARHGPRPSTIWCPPSPGQCYWRRDDAIARPYSISHPVSPLSSPATPNASLQRPFVSAFTTNLENVSPLSDISSRTGRGRGMATSDIGQRKLIRDDTAAYGVPSKSTTTLTGANLWNRLNHPVPPLPPDESHETDQAHHRKTPYVDHEGQPTRSPRHRATRASTKPSRLSNRADSIYLDPSHSGGHPLPTRSDVGNGISSEVQTIPGALLPQPDVQDNSVTEMRSSPLCRFRNSIKRKPRPKSRRDLVEPPTSMSPSKQAQHGPSGASNNAASRPVVPPLPRGSNFDQRQQNLTSPPGVGFPSDLDYNPHHTSEFPPPAGHYYKRPRPNARSYMESSNRRQQTNDRRTSIPRSRKEINTATNTATAITATQPLTSASVPAISRRQDGGEGGEYKKRNKVKHCIVM